MLGVWILILLIVLTNCSKDSKYSSDTLDDATPHITTTYGIHRGVYFEWILPSYSQHLAKASNLPTFYEIGYTKVGNIENWRAVSNVSGLKGDSSSQSLPEVQRIFSRVSSPGILSAGYFRISINRPGFANDFDRERKSRTNRINFDASAEFVENEINSLHIGSDILPVIVSRDGPLVGNTFSWRVTFSRPLSTNIGTPLLMVSEENFAPGIFTGGGRVVAVERVVLRTPGVKPSVTTLSAANSPFPGIAVCIATSIEENEDIECRHSLTGLTPGDSYRIRIRTALSDGTLFSPYSLSSNSVQVPLEILKSAKAQIPSPLLYSLKSSSVVLDVQLPYISVGVRDQRPLISIEVQGMLQESGQWMSMTSNAILRGTRFLHDRDVDPVVSVLVNISELEPMSLYNFRARGFAYNNEGTRHTLKMSQWSLPLTEVFTLSSIPLPPLLRNLRSDDISFSTANVHWSWPLDSLVTNVPVSGSRISRAVAFIVEIREVMSDIQTLQQESLSVSSDVFHGQWRLAKTAMDVREMLLQMGNVNSSIRIRCGEKSDLQTTQSMLDNLQLLKNNGWANKISTIAMTRDNTSSFGANCTYKLSLIGLKPLTIYQIRVAAVATLSATIISTESLTRTRLLFEDDTNNFVKGEFSSPTIRFRTPIQSTVDTILPTKLPLSSIQRTNNDTILVFSDKYTKPTPMNVTIIALNSVSVALAWSSVVWQLMTSSGSIISDQAISYIIERAYATGNSNDNNDTLDIYQEVWKGSGTQTLNPTPYYISTMIDGLKPSSHYLFRVLALFKNGNISLPSLPLRVSTPKHTMNEWKRQSRVHSTNESSRVGSPPPLRGATLTALGGHLYLFGGLASGDLFDCADGPLSSSCLIGAMTRNETWKLDPLTWAWTPLVIDPNRTPPGRERHVAAAINDRIYILGGRSHPDTTRDGGPYLPDFWVLDVGESSFLTRTITIQASTIAINEKYDLSCASTVMNKSTQCGIRELVSNIVSINVLEDSGIVSNSSVPLIDHIGSVPNDSCVESVKVWMEIAHPCLIDLEIYLTYQSEESLEEILLFSGGVSPEMQGSSSIDFICHPTRILTNEYFSTSSVDPISSNAGIRIEHASTIFQTGEDTLSVKSSIRNDVHNSLLEDTRVVFFDDNAIADVSRGCCEWKTISRANKVFLFKPETSSTIKSENDIICSHFDSEEGEEEEGIHLGNESVISSLNGFFRPLSPLFRLHGHRASGRWGLRIIDRAGNNVTGELRDWGIVLETTPCERKSTWTRLFPSSTTLSNDPFITALPLLTLIPEPRVDATSVVVGSSWFLWGGMSAISHSDLWRYDSLINQWTCLQPMASSTLLHSKHERSLGSLGPGLMQHGVISSKGILKWGGLPSMSQNEADSVPGYSISNQEETCISSSEGDVTYTCASPSLVTNLWDFVSSFWKRLHPSQSPFTFSGPSTCLGSSWCKSPPLLRHGAFTIIGEEGTKTQARGIRYPTLVLYGGANVHSGSLHKDLWTLELKETVAIGESFPTVKDEELWPVDSIKATSERWASRKEQGYLKINKKESNYETKQNIQFHSLCFHSLLSGSTSDIEWSNRCLRNEKETLSNETTSTQRNFCRIEDILKRAFCSKSYSSIGLL
jgi:subtilisin-like proprotein convertase family protein